ncbi:MAG: bifunctional oligoribonuclease/PAP phosphatase NrnA [Elusimicrobia bacterium]|nr:bifunctional oligoribonuclease/PAP phosphatase NrnA [Elusimicrobiota bacterium]
MKSARSKKQLSEIAKIIKQSKTFFVAGHVKPDGDTLGSGLALVSMLKRMGKTVKMYSADIVPENLLFMKGARHISVVKKCNQKFDCAIILECVNFNRMGDIIAPEQAKKIVNIDHHTVFTNFGDVNFVVPEASSTAELVFSLFEHMKIAPSPSEAECLYVGLVTDTGRFQQLNTTVESHVAAAKLITAGVSPNAVYEHVYGENRFEKIKLLGLALSDIKLSLGGMLATVKLSPQKFKAANAREDDTENIVNYALTINGVKISALLKESTSGTTKISLRSVKSCNILSIVQKFGGGGHKNAAGFTLKMAADKAEQTLINAFNGLNPCKCLKPSKGLSPSKKSSFNKSKK